ncbi:MAG: hydantoinase/oxoprolinase family protein, partial [Rhodospirillaceae bacterium]|nr:hydantoinase/oxoprolinase family protein [Rhodospirillaceae bacterium]
MKSYLVGVDIGGTFTDCVVIDDEGAVITAKAPSTPDEFSRGMLDAMTAAADSLGLSITELCQSIRLLAHGTTVGTNAVVQ